jgi:hypothetical protein
LSRTGYTQERGRPRVTRRAGLAALCALVPGGGAVYNRQNVKAAVYFITIAGLFQLSAIQPFDLIFGLAGATFYLYTIADSYRTAELIARGESAAENERRFKAALTKRIPAIGLLLIASGLLFLLYRIRAFELSVVLLRLAPVALIMLGGYLLVSYIKRRREEEWSVEEPPRRAFPLFTSRRPDDHSHRFRER